MNAMPNGIETQNDERIDNVNNCNNDTILSFYVQCQNNCKIGLLNINSLRHKFYPIMNILHNQYLDILMRQETKLDDSFPNAHNVHGYVMHRLDYTSYSGGIITYVRSDIPQKSVKLYSIDNLNKGRIELQALELSLHDEKWIVISMYKEQGWGQVQYLYLSTYLSVFYVLEYLVYGNVESTCT